MTWGNLNFHSWSFGSFTRAKSWFLVLEKVDNLWRIKADFGWYIEQSQLRDLQYQLTGIHYPYDPWDWYAYLQEWLIFMVDIGKWKAEGMDAVQLTTTSVQGSGPRLKQCHDLPCLLGIPQSILPCLVFTGRSGYIRASRNVRATNSHIVPCDFLHDLLMGECEQFCFDFGMYIAPIVFCFFCCYCWRWCYCFWRYHPSCPLWGCNLKTLVMTSAYLKDPSSVSNHQ